MATKRLFYKDSFLKTFQAKVEECRQSKKGYEIRLDQTVFYPEGGGQPCDMGTLDQVRVMDVQEKDGDIWHSTKEPIEVGTCVTGEIDWERRLDLMQQHSGEHIVSGMIHERYGYDNIGFHMGEETITVDFDGEIPEEELKEIELEANRYVWENHPLDISWPTEEELAVLPYRSKKELSGDVRIVTWPGADICACCGVHVQHSGEVGQIMLISSQRAKGGVRIEMLCGGRALTYSNRVKEQNREISEMLSAKWNQTAAAVKKLQEEYQKIKFQMVGLELQKIADMVKEKAGQGDQILFVDMTPDGARKLATDVMETCGGICAVFCGDEKSGYRYVIGEKDGDLRGFVKEMNQRLNGRGGGKPFFVQGSVQASEEEIRAFFQEKRG
ncbi:MAG: alanyl-tRNA editing protein [Clostridia bacterium]|nr:alanyl-tRNA editing protein [Clostridia bacterium]NCC42501.1 alanyl-tRNA editing protein [Clostridia bacterium]